MQWLRKQTFLVLSLTFCCAVACHAQQFAITGGTLIDLNDFGRSKNDIVDAVVLIDKGKIIAAGPASQITIPNGVARIDGRGRFLIPGLVDGFGALRNQAFANAYLFDGVTTVYVPTVLPTGGGDGELTILRGGAPGPRLILGAPMTGYSEEGADPSDKPMTEHRLHDRRLTNEQLIARIDRLANQGFRGLTVSYDVWPDQVDVIVGEAKRRGLATLIEPAFTSYPYAVRAGVSVLLHNDHYLLALAPAAAQLARADNLRAGSAANHAVCAADPMAAEVAAYADQLAKSNTALMPTLAMEATAGGLDVPNPWSARSAAIIKASDLDNPVDPSTGAAPYLAGLPAERRKAVRDCAWHREALDARLYQLGVKFLAGSTAAGYGVMPGSGLRQEIGLLNRIGLSPREAIAAATSNFADVYGWPDIGRIETGREADLLILEADPRESVSALEHIHTLVFQGVVVNRARLIQTPEAK
jgi:imidazolonepropionase-like amidohydrolase